MPLEAILEDEKIELDDDAIPAQCYATKDYSVFKHMVGNRDVSEKHVRTLMTSMNRGNLIKYQTILVNEDMEILDGQHRFEACKRLGLHVHYKIVPNGTYKIPAILNHATREWKFNDYLDNFAINEHLDYVKLEAFQNKYNISLKRLGYLMSKEQKEIFDTQFRTGGFKLIDNLEEISIKIDKINDIIKYLDEIILLENKKFLFTDNFWRALYMLLLEKDVDIEKFKEKLTIKRQAVRQLGTHKQYLQLLTDIYNWKTKKSRIE